MGFPTTEMVQPNGTAVYSHTMSRVEQNEVFCARDDERRQTVVFVDDGSEVTLLRKSAARKHWARSKGELANITGIGANKASTGASEMVTIPLRLRSYMEVTMLTCYVVPAEVMTYWRKGMPAKPHRRKRLRSPNRHKV